tara:strand:+ start:27895 stop:28674 length:780 start_codon:yes stop_codon:yes gene_type:complete
MEIPKISIPRREIGVQQIPRVYTPQWLKEAPTVIPPNPPVTSQIGVPIINLPGCVEAHEQNSGKEKSGILSADDPKGVKVFCDSGVPSFNPIDYDKDKLKFPPKKTEPPKIAPPKPPETKTPEVPKTEKPECPTKVQKIEAPVGTLTDAGKKKIVEYRLVEKQCVAIKEDLKIPDQIVKAIPSVGQVTTTAGITIIATAAATATPFLLKVVKPIVKQIIKKIKKALGKEPPKLSQSEVRANKYREKKGLPELKQPKKKK